MCLLSWGTVIGTVLSPFQAYSPLVRTTWSARTTIHRVLITACSRHVRATAYCTDIALCEAVGGAMQQCDRFLVLHKWR